MIQSRPTIEIRNSNLNSIESDGIIWSETGRNVLLVVGLEVLRCEEIVELSHFAVTDFGDVDGETED